MLDADSTVSGLNVFETLTKQLHGYHGGSDELRRGISPSSWCHFYVSIIVNLVDVRQKRMYLSLLPRATWCFFVFISLWGTLNTGAGRPAVSPQALGRFSGTQLKIWKRDKTIFLFIIYYQIQYGLQERSLRLNSTQHGKPDPARKGSTGWLIALSCAFFNWKYFKALTCTPRGFVIWLECTHKKTF